MNTTIMGNHSQNVAAKDNIITTEIKHDLYVYLMGHSDNEHGHICITQNEICLLFKLPSNRAYTCVLKPCLCHKWYLMHFGWITCMYRKISIMSHSGSLGLGLNISINNRGAALRQYQLLLLLSLGLKLALKLWETTSSLQNFTAVRKIEVTNIRGIIVPRD